VTYGGELKASGTISSPLSFLDWLRHDILAEIYRDEGDVSFLSGNSVVVGARLSQVRASTSSTCTTSQLFSQDVCDGSPSSLTFTPSTAPFGVDVTFDPSSPLYHEDDVSKYYSADEIDEATSLPFGFFPDAQFASAAPEKESSFTSFGSRPAAELSGFPVLFDRRLSRDQANLISK
jgi:hypothetical protein